MLKLQCKTTFNSVFVSKKIIKIERVDLGIMFLKNVVLHEIYSTKLNFERQKYNTMIVHLKTNNLSLCLNHEHLKSVLPKNM
jgi:hypothetical protein